MKIYCPHCGVKGSADDSYSGRKVKCPKCQEMFDLTPDMAIDQSEFLTAAPGAEDVGEAVAPDLLQEESDLGILDSPAEEEQLNELLAEDEDSVDWDDFGAELDREIAETEQVEESIDLPQEDAFLDGVGPVAQAVDQNDDLADDLGDLLGATDDEIDGSVEGQIEEEITENLLAADEDSLETADLALTTGEAAAKGMGDTLSTLTAPEVVSSIAQKITDSDDHDEKAVENMAFAEADLPEVDEEEPKVGDGSDDLEVIEDEPYGIDEEQCWQCGKKDSAGEPFIAVDGRLYCTDCLPEEDSNEADIAIGAGIAGAAQENKSQGDESQKVEPPTENEKTFTVGGVIREAWDKVSGIKGAIWAGSAIMYLAVLVVVAAGALLFPDAAAETETGSGLAGSLLSFLSQIVTQVVFMLFTAGLLFMGIRRVAGDTVNWKMIFHGFSFTGKIVVVSILQFILITIGFLLLILPGIYLTVGYGMAIPLIVDKNLSPWQALETSRKAVHKVWWKVAALYLVMALLFIVATIPMGIGLIWIWPMSMVAAGVVYHRLFTK